MLEQIMMRMFALSDFQREGLRGRIKYLGTIDALKLTPVGRGRRTYQLEDILRLLLILELEDAGCTPKHAARIVAGHWPALYETLGHAWGDVRAQEEGRPTSGRMWTIVPRVLADTGAAGVSDEPASAERAGLIEPAKLVEWHPPALGADRHAIFLKLPTMLAACCEAVGRIQPSLETPFRGALDQLQASRRVATAARKRG